MNAILYPCISTILRRKKGKPRSIIELKRFMNDAENQDLVEE